ncbi:Hpt domain-containing protein [Desulfovibrio sp. Fe33]|uniref:Hpt domain-containing protein n=1 Tax=Desulfovibrio sp. Fe33 TaxID=3020842 RepID=UPI00234C6943|nr:Hpt domain-containing protein [Desulfovibrio sp. Fe33]
MKDLFDVDHFLDSVVQDRGLAVVLVEAFIEDCPKRVAELTRALAEDDTDKAGKLAHSLKGMCGVVRAGALSRLALAMEFAAQDGDLDSVRKRLGMFIEELDQAMALMEDFTSRC